MPSGSHSSYEIRTQARLALLIDADNISAKYLPTILDELPKHGIATYRRIYGDFTDSQMASWRPLLLDNSIMPIQSFSNVKSHKPGEHAGKNATDSALIIDAMDILYEGRVDGFVIVSSDSDFTRLAQRLREGGMKVVGMGRNHTSISFRRACTTFVNIEYVNELTTGEHSGTTDADKDGDEGIVTTVTLADVESVVAGIILSNDARGEQTHLTEVGSGLRNKFPEFDVRSLGYTKLSKLIGDMKRFDLVEDGGVYKVSFAGTADVGAVVAEFVRTNIANAGGKMKLSLLATNVHNEYPEFKHKDAGYSQFWKYVDGIKGVSVYGPNRQMVKLNK